MDIMDNNVPEIVFEKHKRELIGLGVSDMYRCTSILIYLAKYSVSNDPELYVVYGVRVIIVTTIYWQSNAGATIITRNRRSGL